MLWYQTAAGKKAHLAVNSVQFACGLRRVETDVWLGDDPHIPKCRRCEKGRLAE